MKKIILLILLTVLLVACSEGQSQNKIVDIKHSADIKDYTSIIREALNANPKGNVTIRFNKGVYVFFPEQAFGKYLKVSNNDNGDKRIVFKLENMNNIEIKGDSTTFMLHGKLVPFFISNCSNVLISGVNIDYDFPFVFEGKVVANNPTEKSFDVQAHPDNPFEIIGDRFFFSGYKWKSELGENIVFDANTHRPLYYTSKYEHANTKKELRAKEISNGIIRFSGLAASEVPPVGSIYTDKGPHGKNREVPGFVIQNSSNINLTHVNVFRSGAMALIAEKSKDITLESYNVCLHNGSGRMLSASADATHFINCSGLVKMRNCRFESMLDDATNVHGTYMYAKEFIGDHKIGAVFGHYQQEGFEFGQKGDSIQLVDRTNLMMVGKGIIKDIDDVNENYYVIETDINLSKLNNANVAIDNISNNASVHIDKCSIKYNRARSLLISTPKPVLIENCYFASMMAGIRICGDANYWFESGSVQDVIIRNNTFEDLGIGGNSPQAILQIDPIIPKTERGAGFYHGKVVFENNIVRTFDAQIIYALSVDTLVIKGNTFIDSKKYAPIFSDLSVIDALYCNNLIIHNNNYDQWKPNASISIFKCSNVKMDSDDKIKTVENPNKYFYQN